HAGVRQALEAPRGGARGGGRNRTRPPRPAAAPRRIRHRGASRALYTPGVRTLDLRAGDKTERYRELLPQLDHLTRNEPDLIANLANLSAALKQAVEAASWVGFYLRRGDELVLGPFQGKVACVRIRLGQGVCSTAAAERRTVIVPDVDAFPGHIRCHPDSRME